MKKNYLLKRALLGIAATALIVTGCGSSKGADGMSSADYMVEESAADSYNLYDNAAGSEYKEAPAEGAEGDNQNVADKNRKLITTVNLTTETEDLTQTVANVEAKVSELGGYIESSNIYNGNGYSKDSRSASITARIPAAKLQEFVDTVDGSTNITQKSVNVDDVTLEYVDINSKKNALKTEEKRLTEILASAETVEDMITIEDRLAQVRYELESIESQLRTYDNKVDYSTVYLEIDEVITYTPTEKKGVFSRMGEGFLKNLHEVTEGLIEFCIWFVSHLPQMILLAIIGLIIFLIVKLIMKKDREKSLKRMAQRQEFMRAQAGMAATQTMQNNITPQPVNMQSSATENNKNNGNKQ